MASFPQKSSYYSLILLTSFISTYNCQSCIPTQIQFSDDGLQLYVKFNQELSTIVTSDLLDTPSSCDSYFDQESILLLSDSTCYFDSTTEAISSTSALLIDLSPTAIIQPTIESLTLIPNAFQCSNISQTLVIDPPINEPNTEIIIDSTVPTTIGSCDTFIITASSSTGK